MTTAEIPSSCALCPRKCGANRLKSRGFCGAGRDVRVARAMIHKWEEPLIVGDGGAGAVFFSGCSLRCVYCQNFDISHGNFGVDITVERLAEIFHRLVESGASTLDLVTPTQYLPQIRSALAEYEKIHGKLEIPVVFNSGGYERDATIREYADMFDVYLPDFKYCSSELSARYSAAPDYFEVAMSAIRAMVDAVGRPQVEGGVIRRGVIVRHLVLPGAKRDTEAVLRALAAEFGDAVLLSLMRQYTPREGLEKPLNRRICSFEYDAALELAESLGLVGFMQDKESASAEYTPEFNGDLLI